MAKRNKIKSARPLLKLEALEQRQLLAGGFTTAQGTEFSNIVHANGNVYDQVLLKSSAITISNDAGQITRVSFLDLQGDIVQAEFSGAGQLSISLDNFSGPAEATKYAQPGVHYVSGLASFTIQGSDSTTNFSVFSVGSSTANGGKENPIFAGGLTGGDNNADVARLTIVANPANPNGSTFGGIRAGNAVFGGSEGPVGISAANVQVQNVVTIGDVNATGTATPTLIFGTQSQFGAVSVAGGDLVSDNGKSVNNTGSYAFGVNLTAGTTSGGTTIAAVDSTKAGSFTGSNPFNATANSFTLTTSVDTIPGLSGTAGTGNGGNDTINGTIGTGATLTALDSINGGKGTDTLVLLDLSGGTTIPAGVTLSSVEVINLRSSGAANIDASAYSDVTTLNVTQGTSSTATAAKTSALNVSGITGTVIAKGGLAVTVSTEAGDVTVGNGATTADAPAGAVSVTDSKQAATDVVIDGGTTVAVTTTGAGSGGTIAIGGSIKPTGAVTVSSTGAAYDAAASSLALGTINVTGGTTVSVTQVAASASTAAAEDTAATVITQSAVTITGVKGMTGVTVTQSAPVTAVNYVAAAGSKEVSELTFAAMVATDTTTIEGLTFTAAKALTAEQAAAAFANLAASATQGTAAVSSGVYSGVLSSTFSSGAASAAKVTFTAASNANPSIAVTAGGVDPTISANTDGVATTTGTAGVMGVAGGAVTINDSADKTISSVSLSGYGTTGINNIDGLTTLSLANSNADVTLDQDLVTTLGLTVSAVGTSTTNAGGVAVDSTYTTINLNATGTSWIALNAPSVTNLNVSGSKVVNVGSTTGGETSTLSALTTVTVTGSAGLTLGNSAGTTITSIDASGTSGAVSASLIGNVGTFLGSTGSDTVTLTGTSVTKAITTGTGNDTVNLASGTTTLGAVINAGSGDIDTLKFGSTTDAATASLSSTFADSITGFDKISLPAAFSTDSVNLDNLDAINYVVSAGTNNAKEKFTVTFGGTAPVDTDTLIFDGVTTTYSDASPTLAEFITAAAGKTYTNWTVSGSTATTITFEANKSGTVTDAVAGDFTGTAITVTGATATPVTSVQGSTLGALTVTNMPANGTLELTAAGLGATVTLKDATGTADMLNVITTNSGGISAGTVTAAGVETIKWTATDTTTTTVDTHSLTIKAADATTLTLAGTAKLTLTLDAATAKVSLIDGSALTTALTVTGNTSVAQTIKGGTAADILTAGFQGDTLQGGAGNDTLIANGKSLVTLSGGAGNDTFEVGVATSNVNSYATITDLEAGDKIKFNNTATDPEVFKTAAITLDPTTAVFQDYANAAIAGSAAVGTISWFQYSGNTYVVERVTGSTSFVNNSDVIVKIAGLKDLSTASFNGSTADTLLIV